MCTGKSVVGLQLFVGGHCSFSIIFFFSLSCSDELHDIFLAKSCTKFCNKTQMSYFHIDLKFSVFRFSRNCYFEAKIVCCNRVLAGTKLFKIFVQEL
jgi:hypothetical protein